jgi:hypothetical protein
VEPEPAAEPAAEPPPDLSWRPNPWQNDLGQVVCPVTVLRGQPVQLSSKFSTSKSLEAYQQEAAARLAELDADAQREADSSEVKLSQVATKAAAKLEALIDGKKTPPAVVLGCCRCVLEFSYRGADHANLAARINELELKARKNAHTSTANREFGDGARANGSARRFGGAGEAPGGPGVDHDVGGHGTGRLAAHDPPRFPG